MLIILNRIVFDLNYRIRPVRFEKPPSLECPVGRLFLIPVSKRYFAMYPPHTGTRPYALAGSLQADRPDKLWLADRVPATVSKG